jgi:hypothetical protein
MSKVRTVAATIALMLCASVSYAQSPSSNPGSYTLNPAGPMYAACWAEVPSQNSAYFSATFAASSVNALRKQFRSFVTTQFGPVSKLQCTGKFSGTVVNEQVEKWKDSARTTNNAIIDLLGGDKAAEAPQPQSPQSVRYEGPHSGFGFPPGPPPSVPSLSTTLQRY